MKIVNWTEFKKQPMGTIFQEILEGVGELQPLSILTHVDNEETTNDFYYAQLTPEMVDIGTLGDYRPSELKSFNGDVVLHPSGIGRYGRYDLISNETKRWLIWENVDRERLAHWLLNPEMAVGQQNDDDLILPVPYIAPTKGNKK